MLAWTDAYDLTGNKVYLSMAEAIFADMASSWDKHLRWRNLVEQRPHIQERHR